MADWQLIDDYGGSSEFVYVEDAREGVTPQALWFRVGPVFGPDGEEHPVPGVWVTYQAGYLKTPLEGPVLLSPAAWQHLEEAVTQRLAARGAFPEDLALGSAGAGHAQENERNGQDVPS